MNPHASESIRHSPVPLPPSGSSGLCYGSFLDKSSSAEELVNFTNHEISKMLDDLMASRYTDKRELVIEFNPTCVSKDLIAWLIGSIADIVEREFYGRGMLSTHVAAAFIVLYVLVLVFGWIFNLTIVYAFSCSKKMRTFRNIYIINLAIR